MRDIKDTLKEAKHELECRLDPESRWGLLVSELVQEVEQCHIDLEEYKRDLLEAEREIAEKCVSILENEYWGDGHEVYFGIDLIKKYFGLKTKDSEEINYDNI